MHHHTGSPEPIPATRATDGTRLSTVLALLLLAVTTATVGAVCAVTGGPTAVLASASSAAGGAAGVPPAVGVAAADDRSGPPPLPPAPADEGPAPGNGSTAGSRPVPRTPSAAARPPAAAAASTTASASGSRTSRTSRSTRSATQTGVAPGSPAPGQRTTGTDDPAAAGREVLVLVNAQRAAAGCSALTADPHLAALALAHSTDMRDRRFFDHTNPDGSSPFDRAKAAGVTTMRAENIAQGQQSPAAVMAAWMASPGHRANILDCRLRTLGVGVAYGSGGPWWTQDFGS